MPNELITIEGGGHGGFKALDIERIYKAIRTFLARHRIVKRAGSLSDVRPAFRRLVATNGEPFSTPERPTPGQLKMC